jgi:hypothetical protein
MTTKVQYPICYVHNMYISIHKVGINGCGHSDILDSLTMEKSLGHPY